MNRRKDQILGCMLGAAAGDALGFCVDDLNVEEIGLQYGPDGIQGYDCMNGWATFSAHTQLMLYTANALLFGATRGATRGRMAPYVTYLETFYREWAQTQSLTRRRSMGTHYAWLSTVRELHDRRRPDRQTLYCMDSPQLGTVEEPINRSKSPSGLTRSIPIGLFLSPEVTRPEEIRLLGAESAALTVGDGLGWLPAAYLTELLNRIIYGKQDSFRNVLHEAHEAMREQFGQNPQLRMVRELLEKAESLCDEAVSPKTAMRSFEGNDGANALAAACYACLKFPGDFDRCVVTAVNHGGASAAAGMTAGALLGAMVGTEGIPEFYLEPLELREVLEELADDLYQGCPMSRSANLFDDLWDQKYVQCTH